MAPVLSISSLNHRPPLDLPSLLPARRSPTFPRRHVDLRNPKSSRDGALWVRLNGRGRCYCLFSDNRKKQDQAKKALEGALGGKKSEFEKWNKEIERRTELGGGGRGGEGGRFGGGGGDWFGRFNNEHFRDDAWQAILTLTGIVFLYLLITKGGIMFAVVSNSLLYALRGVRNGFSFVSSFVAGNRVPATEMVARRAEISQVSAKDSVVKKWGAD